MEPRVPAHETTLTYLIGSRLRITENSAVDDLHAWGEVDGWSWVAASITVLTGALEQGVDLVDVQVLVNKVADVVRDHGMTLRACLRVVVDTAFEVTEALPAE